MAPDNAPRIIRIFADGDFLYAETAKVKKLPLYVFSEYLADPAAKPPYSDDWPSYIKGYAESYLPVLGDPKPVIDTNLDANEFYFATRPERLHRSWRQLLYRGYPLYIFGDGQHPDPRAEVSGASIEGHSAFKQARVIYATEGPGKVWKGRPGFPPILGP